MRAAHSTDTRKLRQDMHKNRLLASDADRLARIICFSSDSAVQQRLLVFAMPDGLHDEPRVVLQFTRSGKYFLHIDVLKAFELVATYYSGTNFELPFFSGPALSTDFSQTTLHSAYEEKDPGLPDLPKNTFYSVRWSGFLRPAQNEIEDTARLSVSGVDERLKLWIDQHLVVDQWSSLESTQRKASLVFGRPSESKGYYQVDIEYKQEWGSSGLSIGFVGAPSALARFEALSSSPVFLEVRAGNLDLARSRLFGNALTLATACVSASFTVMARDVYGNSAQVAVFLFLMCFLLSRWCVCKCLCVSVCLCVCASLCLLFLCLCLHPFLPPSLPQKSSKELKHVSELTKISAGGQV